MKKNKFIKIYNDLDIKNKTTRELYNYILVIEDELLYRKKVWFAQGAGTSTDIEQVKDTLKERLDNQFQYKDDLNIKKFWG